MRISRLLPMLLIPVLFAATVAVAEDAPVQPAEKPQEDAKQSQEKDPHAWKPLFDGKTLEGWTVPEFGGDGEVTVEDGAIVIGVGSMMTGVKLKGEPPAKVNYEVVLEAERTEGCDFFATATLPYKDSHFSLVVAGWGGAVVGISSVDGYDAAENSTSRYVGFKDDTWYRIRIRVSENMIEAWINELDKEGKPIIDKQWIKEHDGDARSVALITKGHEIGTRFEVDIYRPLGVTTWQTEGRVRKVDFRTLKKAEVDQINEEVKKDPWYSETP